MRQHIMRQGDVLLIATTRTPSDTARRIRDQGRTILASGEITGHYHEVVTAVPRAADSQVQVIDDVPAQELFEEPDGSRLLVVRSPSALRHAEHAPIDLPAGSTYEVRRQCEWGLGEIRQVAD